MREGGREGERETAVVAMEMLIQFQGQRFGKKTTPYHFDFSVSHMHEKQMACLLDAVVLMVLTSKRS